MATTTEVEIKLTVDGSQPEKSVGSIKSQLKLANAELIEMREKFGDTSAEAIQAAKKVANLKDSIGDAKAMADAFNPDAKFKAFGSALQGVAGGFSAVQGAMGLMGSESEDVEKMLLKVNSAMALSQGINSVLEAKDSFKNLSTVVKSFSIVQKIITAGQWLWNAAMSANPIGAVVVAITALIAGVIALTSYFMSNAKASRENAKAVKENAKALDEQKKANTKANDELQRAQSYQLAMAKANGETTKSIRALELKLIDEKIATEKASRETAINTYEKNKNALASLKQAGASDEVIKKQEETTKASLEYANEQTANLNKSLIDKVELQRKHNVEIATENNNANKEASQKAKQDADEKKKIQEDAIQKRKDLTKQFGADLKALEDANYLNGIADENKRALEKLRIDYENEQTSIKQKGFLKEEETKLLAQIDKKYELDVANLKAEQKKKEDEEAKAKAKKLEDDANAKLQKQIAFEEGTFKILNDLRISQLKSETDKARENEALRYQADIDANYEALNNKEITQAEFDARAEANKKLHESKVSDIQKTESENRIKQDELERKTKIDSAKAIGDSLGALSDLVGKQTATGKALGVAQALINTYIGASEVLRAKTTLPEPIGTISKVINVATIIATGIKSVKAIIGTKVPTASGGGGGGSVPSVPSITPPLPPQLNTQMINGGQINQLASATSRAYVVESDVSGNQERINRLNRASRIN